MRRQQLQELRREASVAATRTHVAGPLRILEVRVLCARQKQHNSIRHPAAISSAIRSVLACTAIVAEVVRP